MHATTNGFHKIYLYLYSEVARTTVLVSSLVEWTVQQHHDTWYLTHNFLHPQLRTCNDLLDVTAIPPIAPPTNVGADAIAPPRQHGIC